MRVCAILVLVATAGTAMASEPPTNRVVLRMPESGPEVRQAVKELLGARLARFGLSAKIRIDAEGRLRVDLPPLAKGQPARVLRLLTSRGEIDVVSLKDGSVVIPAGDVLGLVTSLEGERVQFRLRLKEEARKAWAKAPGHLVLRHDGLEIQFFEKKTDGPPVIAFPAAYPREDLRVLFCCVRMGPLPVTLEVVEKTLASVADPARAWKDLLKGWAAKPPAVTGTAEYRRRGDAAVYTTSTRVVERDGRSLYLLEDRLRVPDHPEQNVLTAILCDRDWSVVQGRILTGGQTVALKPKDVSLAPGVALRLAPLLPTRVGGAFGPGGRLRVRAGPVPGAVEVVSPTRPVRIVVEDGRVVSFMLGAEGEPFVRTR